MRSLLCKTAAAGLAGTLGLASASSWAVTNHVVTVGGAAGNRFTDAQTGTNVTNIAAGDTVTFTNAGGFHNAESDPGAITSFHCSDVCGTSPTGDASSNLWSATVTFPTPGTIGYHCNIHGAPGQGMFGTINVTVPVELQSFDVD